MIHCQLTVFSYPRLTVLKKVFHILDAKIDVLTDAFFVNNYLLNRKLYKNYETTIVYLTISQRIATDYQLLACFVCFV